MLQSGVYVAVLLALMCGAARGVGISFQQPDSLSWCVVAQCGLARMLTAGARAHTHSGKNFTLVWKLDEPDAWASGATLRIALAAHVSFSENTLLDELAEVPASAGRWVWAVPDVLPVAWQNTELIFLLHKTDDASVNNYPSVNFWCVC